MCAIVLLLYQSESVRKSPLMSVSYTWKFQIANWFGRAKKTTQNVATGISNSRMLPSLCRLEVKGEKSSVLFY